MSGLLKIVLLPPGCFIALALAGALLWRRHPQLGKSLCALALFTLYFFSTGVGSWLVAHPLEQLEAPLPVAATGAQAIVVLTAGRVRRSPEYGAEQVPDFVARERIAYGARLVRQRALPLLVTGGLNSDAPGEEPLAFGMQRAFEQDYRIPVKWVESAARTTAENAVFSARMLKRDGISHIILVTDAVHMRRARRAFERAGLTVTAGPTFYTETSHFDITRLWPTMESLRRSYAALYEWAGLLDYEWRAA
jgi:uncharacterized SAM-binding protein YcdF (DUF218 family)